MGAEHERIITLALRIELCLHRKRTHTVETILRSPGYAAVEQTRRHLIFGVFERATQCNGAGRTAVVILRRPVIFCLRVLPATDWRPRDRLVIDERIGLHPRVERSEIGYGL